MHFGLSMFADSFLGAGVPLEGDPITAFQNVSLLGLRVGTVLNNCRPTVGEVVKVRLIATNCGVSLVDFNPLLKDNLIALRPGESTECSVFRSWEAPAEQQLAFPFEARRPGEPFARLTYPAVCIHVRHAQANQIAALDTAIVTLFHVIARRRGTSEFSR